MGDLIPALSTRQLEATPTGLIIHGNLPFEIWAEYGKGLRRVEGAIQWILGDWLAFGDAKYGERYTQALSLWPDSSYTALSNYKVTAERVSKRLETLSWSHHFEVRHLEAPEQTKWLEEAERTGMSVRELRDALRGTEEPEEERCPECGAAKRHWRIE